MAEVNLKGKKVLFIIANEGFQATEYNVTKNILIQEGITVITASDKPGAAIAHDQSSAPVDVTLDNVHIKDYDGIFFIGGPGTMDHLDNGTSYHILKEAEKAAIPYGAICIAPRILVKAGVLKHKKATGWNDDNALETIYKGHDIIYKKEPMVTDDLVVTAEGPKAAKLFGQGIIRVLTKKKLD